MQIIKSNENQGHKAYPLLSITARMFDSVVGRTAPVGDACLYTPRLRVTEVPKAILQNSLLGRRHKDRCRRSFASAKRREMEKGTT
ncbi:hypothetical protein TNCV_1651371 [Trichonephila clavipes]|nr:hypothetical protein TNCV_1651371 [Trichonephila clavipes]